MCHHVSVLEQHHQAAQDQQTKFLSCFSFVKCLYYLKYFTLMSFNRHSFVHFQFDSKKLPNFPRVIRIKLEICKWPIAYKYILDVFLCNFNETSQNWSFFGPASLKGWLGYWNFIIVQSYLPFIFLFGFLVW
jgi:hypothetical protein